MEAPSTAIKWCKTRHITNLRIAKLMDHLWITGVDARWGWYPMSIDKDCIRRPISKMAWISWSLTCKIHVLPALFVTASNGNLWRTFKATFVLRKFGSTTYARLQWLMIRENCVMSLLSWWQILLYFQCCPWCVLIGPGSSSILAVATAWA